MTVVHWMAMLWLLLVTACAQDPVLSTTIASTGEQSTQTGVEATSAALTASNALSTDMSPSQGCIDNAPFCEELSAVGGCNTSNAALDTVMALNCPLSCGICSSNTTAPEDSGGAPDSLESGPSGSVFLCLMPPSSSSRERCKAYSASYCFNVTLNQCNLIKSQLPTVENYYVRVVQQANLTSDGLVSYSWRLHQDDQCQDLFALRSDVRGQSQIGDCQQVSAFSLPYLADISFFRNCLEIDGTYTCVGDNLACTHPSLDNQRLCPSDRCVWDSYLAMCHEPQAPPQCDAYPAPACGPERCAYDAYTRVCRPVRDQCRCTTSKKSGNVTVPQSNCHIGDGATDFPGRPGCYLEAGSDQSCTCAVQSVKYPGALWRSCSLGCSALQTTITDVLVGPPASQLPSAFLQLEGLYIKEPDRHIILPSSDGTGICGLLPGYLQQAAVDDRYVLGSNLYADAGGVSGNLGFWILVPQSQRLAVVEVLFGSSDEDPVISVSQTTTLAPENNTSPWQLSVQGNLDQVLSAVVSINMECVLPPCLPVEVVSAELVADPDSRSVTEQTTTMAHAATSTLPESSTRTSTTDEVSASLSPWDSPQAQAQPTSFDTAGPSVFLDISWRVLLAQDPGFNVLPQRYLLSCEGIFNTSLNGNQVPIATPRISLQTNQTSASRVGPLQPLATYTCSIQTDASDCSAATHPAVTFNTPPQRPVGHPSIPTVAATNSTLDISFELPSPDVVRCQAISIEVAIRRASGQATADPADTQYEQGRIFNLSTSSRQLMLTGLEAGVKYEVRQRIICADFQGPWSPIRLVTTAAGVPEAAPALAEVERTGPETFFIRWDPIPGFLANGPIQSYTVDVYELVNETLFAGNTSGNRARSAAYPSDAVANAGVPLGPRVSSHVIAPGTQASIGSLGSTRAFAVTMAAETSAGRGPFSEPEVLAAYSGSTGGGGGSSTSDVLVIVLPIVAVLVVLLVVALLFVRKTHRRFSLAQEFKEIVIPEELEPLEISRQQIGLSRTIGEGYFGNVFEGTVTLMNDEDEPTELAVAAKVLKPDIDPIYHRRFIDEAMRMRNLNHKNVLRLVGVSFHEEPRILLTELMLCDLGQFLREHAPLPERPAIISQTQQMNMCFQVAQGLCYLHDRHLVHRDLAARNILISGEGELKIADFGSARILDNIDHYRRVESREMPTRWMAPESISAMVFTTQSDVWSFGVVMWEVFSFGNVPWMGLTNEEVARYVVKRDNQNRLPRPDGCPMDLYDLQRKCWDFTPDKRPVAHELVRLLEEAIHKVEKSQEVLAHQLLANRVVQPRGSHDSGTSMRGRPSHPRGSHPLATAHTASGHSMGGNSMLGASLVRQRSRGSLLSNLNSSRRSILSMFSRSGSEASPARPKSVPVMEDDENKDRDEQEEIEPAPAKESLTVPLDNGQATFGFNTAASSNLLTPQASGSAQSIHIRVSNGKLIISLPSDKIQSRRTSAGSNSSNNRPRRRTRRSVSDPVPPAFVVPELSSAGLADTGTLSPVYYESESRETRSGLGDSSPGLGLVNERSRSPTWWQQTMETSSGRFGSDLELQQLTSSKVEGASFGDDGESLLPRWNTQQDSGTASRATLGIRLDTGSSDQMSRPEVHSIALGSDTTHMMSSQSTGGSVESTSAVGVPRQSNRQAPSTCVVNIVDADECSDSAATLSPSPETTGSRARNRSTPSFTVSEC